jgi:hypothetical protein
MIISDNPKLIYIHVHRTGGAAFSNILKANLANNYKERLQHAHLSSLRTTFFEKNAGYFAFGFTRNPWDRILSWYSLIHFNDQKSLAKERERFEAFIESDAALADLTSAFQYNSLDYFSNEKGEIKVNKIFHFENLDNEVESLFTQFNLPLREIPLVNETTKKNYQDYYTDKSRHLIAQKCKKDIDCFNYTF